MSGDGWIDLRERAPGANTVVAVLRLAPGERLYADRDDWEWVGRHAVWRGGSTPLAWQELPPLPTPPPCWPPPGARLAELRRELAELAARRDEASNAALDCGMEIRRVEAEIARIEGGGR